MYMETNNKELNKMIRDLVNIGWRYVIGKKHIKMYSPDSLKILVVSKTPSDFRVLRKLRVEYNKACYENACTN